MTKDIPLEPLLSVKEVAKILNVKASTIYEWVRINYIPHIRLGTGLKKPCVRFSAAAIEGWLKEKAQSGRTTRVPS